MEFHINKWGEKIRITDLETDHLKNIIRYIKRRAQTGIQVRTGGGSCAEDLWYDIEVLHGKDAECYLNLSKYETELNRRRAQEQVEKHGNTV